MFKKSSHIVILVFLLIGVIFTGTGLLLTLVVVPSVNAEVAQLEQFESASAVVLADTRPGKTVLVEGFVSNSNPSQHKTFIAYVREEYKTDGDMNDDDDDSGWYPRQQVSPPLLLETANGGPIQVTNETYTFQPSKIIEQDSRTRFRVIEAGDPVVVIGQLSSSDEPPQVIAQIVVAGNKADYLAGQQDSATAMHFMATLFLVLGVLFLVAGLGVVVATLVRRFYPTP